MPAHCCAWNCKNRDTKTKTNVKFYRFPRDPVRRSQWAAALRRVGFVATEHSRICSAHFVKGLSIVYLCGVSIHTAGRLLSSVLYLFIRPVDTINSLWSQYGVNYSMLCSAKMADGTWDGNVGAVDLSER